MTAVSASTSTAASTGYGRSLLDRGGGKGQGGGASTAAAAASGDQVTLSAAARALIAARTAAADPESRADLIARTKADLAALQAEAGDGTLDLAALDRRQLYAVAADLGGFDADAVAAAGAEMKLRLGDALRGPEAAAGLTGRLGGLYAAADAFLDAAGPEEKASDAWTARKAAVAAAERKLAADADADTSGIADDPVSEYFAGKEDGSTVRANRDFAAVARDARALIDALKQATGRRDAADLDLADIDGRSLAAMALNEGEQFDYDEIRAARQELRARSRADLMASLAGSDPRALSLGIVSQYAGMSAEERDALGWTGDVQATAVSSYEHTSEVLNILSGAATGAGARLLSLAAYL